MAENLNTIDMSEMPRSIIEAEIERLISILDDIDPEPGLEDGGDDEPSLAAPEHQWGSWRGCYAEAYEDRDLECEDGGSQCEDEGAICEDEAADAGSGFGNYLGECSPIFVSARS